MEIIFPVLSYVMAFIGFLSLAMAFYGWRYKEETYIKVVATSFFSGFILYGVAIIFGEKLH